METEPCSPAGIVKRALCSRAAAPMARRSAGFSMSLQIPAARASTSCGGTSTPSWPRDKVTAMQRQLRRLGLYSLGIDGLHGRGTDAGLVEAFGGY